MRVAQVVPAAGDVELAGALGPLTSRDAPSLAPFSAEALDYCDAVARAILRTPQARRDPALVALAYWMRRAEVHCLAAEFAALETSDTVLVPRGLVFHVPPRNVDTMFVYSFVLSLLVGNRNVIRISPRRSEQTELLCTILDRALADARFAAIAATTRILSYGHDEQTTRALSLAADVRMIWGGDDTVATVRAFPARST
jgi:hypothetical protein